MPTLKEIKDHIESNPVAFATITTNNKPNVKRYGGLQTY